MMSTCLESTCNRATKLGWTQWFLVFFMEQIYTTRAITGQTINIISTGIPIKNRVCNAGATALEYRRLATFVHVVSFGISESSGITLESVMNPNQPLQQQ
jgi:hypothetical protein